MAFPMAGCPSLEKATMPVCGPRPCGTFSKWQTRRELLTLQCPHSAYSQVAAVSYDIQSGGVVPETCSDTGGGQDVGTIQNG